MEGTLTIHPSDVERFRKNIDCTRTQSLRVAYLLWRENIEIGSLPKKWLYFRRPFEEGFISCSLPAPIGKPITLFRYEFSKTFSARRFDVLRPFILCMLTTDDAIDIAGNLAWYLSNFSFCTSELWNVAEICQPFWRPGVMEKVRWYSRLPGNKIPMPIRTISTENDVSDKENRDYVEEPISLSPSIPTKGKRDRRSAYVVSEDDKELVRLMERTQITSPICRDNNVDDIEIFDLE